MLYTFDPKLLIITFGGIPLTGFAEGTVLTIERSEDMFKEYVGASGEVSRAKSNNRTGTAKLSLAQTSPANDYLSTMALLDESVNAGVRPFFAKDGLGTSIFMAPQAYVKKVAPAAYGKDIQAREWTIFLVDINIFVGGNIPQI